MYTYLTELVLLLLQIRGWIWNRTFYTTDYRTTRYFVLLKSNFNGIDK